MPPLPICFVICPIGKVGSPEHVRSDLLIEKVIRPALSQCGYEPLRADQIKQPGIITSQIVEHLLACPLVIADLSGENPNVFYELAVRHSVRKPVIHLAEKGSRIPFDIGAMRAFFYDLSKASSVRDSVASLAESIRSLNARQLPAESPVSLAARSVLEGSLTDDNRELWRASERIMYDVPRAYLSRETSYAQIPVVIREVDNSEPGVKQMWLAALHGHSGPRLVPKIPEIDDFDQAVETCVASRGGGRWEVRELLNVVTLDRLKRVKGRLRSASQADGYEVRAFCLPRQLPLISPMVIGNSNLFLGVEDPRFNRISSAIHIDHPDAVKAALQYLGELWNDPSIHKIRTAVGADASAIESLEREIRALP